LYSIQSRFADFDNDLIDITNSIIEELLKSFNSDIVEIWDETINVTDKTTEETENNNARILSYLYSILRTVTNQFFKGTVYEEDIKLTQIVSDQIKILVENNNLSFQSINYKKLYFISGKNIAAKYYDEVKSYTGPFINIWRGENKEERKQLNHESIKNGILEIIRTLEDYKFSISDISRIIKNNSNFDIPVEKVELLNDDGDRDDSKNEGENVFVDSSKKPDELVNEYRNNAVRFLEKFENLYPDTKNGKKIFNEDIKILYWKYADNDLTQEQIALRVFNNKKRFRTISTRLVSINKKLNLLKSVNIFNPDTVEMNAILVLIKKRFIIK
jgi:hypothetical protein